MMSGVPVALVRTLLACHGAQFDHASLQVFAGTQQTGKYPGWRAGEN
jgi:hypothetical protein